MYVKVKVTANAKKEVFEIISKDYFKISVREKALQNMANNRIKIILLDHFNLIKGKVRLISGHHSQNKIYAVDK